MLIASIYGRLAADPVARTTKTGKPMTTASVAVDVSGRDAEGETLWVSILALRTATRTDPPGILSDIVPAAADLWGTQAPRNERDNIPWAMRCQRLPGSCNAR